MEKIRLDQSADGGLKILDEPGYQVKGDLFNRGFICNDSILSGFLWLCSIIPSGFLLHGAFASPDYGVMAITVVYK